MKYLRSFLAKQGKSATYRTYETQTCVTHGVSIPEYSYPQGPTEPTEPREPGDDDDRGLSPAWLAEFNARIGRPS